MSLSAFGTKFALEKYCFLTFCITLEYSLTWCDIYLSEEFPVVGAVAEDKGLAGRSCNGNPKESSLVVVVVTSKLRLALDEEPCNINTFFLDILLTPNNLIISHLYVLSFHF